MAKRAAKVEGDKPKAKPGYKICPECKTEVAGPRTKVCPTCAFEFPIGKRKKRKAKQKEAATAATKAAPKARVSASPLEAAADYLKSMGGLGNIKAARQALDALESLAKRI